MSFLFFSGCSSHRAVVNRPAPAPAPGDRTEPANRPSEAGPAGGASRPGVAPAPAPEGYVEEGNASWYGVPFHGRRAANGETYDMYKLTAAHRTLPFDTLVRVTNLFNNDSTVVRITDRGPFVDNRIIDLSFGAARELDMVVAGIAPVRIEVLSSASYPTAGFFTVQVGAFLDRANAERLRERLAASYSPIFIQQFDSPDGLFYRVRVGRISGEDDARQFSETLRQKEGIADPLVVRLDNQ